MPDLDRPDLSALWPLLPPWIDWAAMDHDLFWFGHYKEPTADVDDTENWVNGGIEDMCGSLFIPSRYAPRWYGDWRTSLTRRPKG